MSLTFFANSSDTLLKKNLSNSEKIASTDDSTQDTDRDSGTTVGTFTPDNNNLLQHRKLRLHRSPYTLDDLLEHLLRNLQEKSGNASENYLEQLIIFLTRNPNMVNRVPNKFHSNPLELVIRLGNTKAIQALLQLKANVRPENRNLLKSIEQLLHPEAQHRQEKEVMQQREYVSRMTRRM